MIFRRLRNLWRMSNIDIPEDPDEKTVLSKLKDAISVGKAATIVDLSDPIDLFENDPTE